MLAFALDCVAVGSTTNSDVVQSRAAGNRQLHQGLSMTTAVEL